MARIFKKTKGFSLVEVLVVIAIISIFIGAAVMNFGQTRSRALLEDGRASIINALELAKNRAASGVGSTSTKHGVRIDSDKIIIFEGDIFPGSGQEIPLSFTSTDKNNFDIIFDRISGKSSTGTIIQITHPSGATTSVTISETGLISTF